MKLLSICIPTYNRKKYLLELLGTIVPQIDDNNKKCVEICISDNASTDGTEQFIDEFKKQYSQIEIKYKKNEVNLGADLNYLKVVEMATGKYCWLMGSDDGLYKGSIDKILKYIQENNVSILVGNRIGCNKNLKPMFKDYWLKTDKDFIIDFRNKEQIIDYFSKLNSTTSCFGYLSVLIINKQQWDNVKYDNTYTGTAYSHVYMILSILYKNGGKLLYSREIFTLSRYGNDSFHDNLKQRIFLDLKGYYKISNDIFQDIQIKRCFLNILCRHYDDLFLHTLNYNMDKEKISNTEIEILKGIGYLDKQIKILTYMKPRKSLYMMMILIIKLMFSNFNLFYQRSLITVQKFKK